MTNIHFFKFVPYPKVWDYLSLGWMVSIPNDAMHHHYYGCEMKWICGCKLRLPVKQ